MPIPQYLKASLSLSRSEQFAGDVDLQQLPRLKAELAGPSEHLRVSLALEQDRVGNWMRGSIAGSLDLACRSCESVFALPMKLRVQVRLVRSDGEAQAVLEDADPYIVEDDRLPLLEMVEDEVLLALPMMPRCQACEIKASALAPEPAKVEEGKRPNPFAQLLKKDRQ